MGLIQYGGKVDISYVARTSYSGSITLSNPGVVVVGLFAKYDVMTNATCTINGITATNVLYNTSRPGIKVWISNLLSPGSVSVNISNLLSTYATWGAVFWMSYAMGYWPGSAYNSAFTGYVNTFTTTSYQGDCLLYFLHAETTAYFPFMSEATGTIYSGTGDSNARIQYRTNFPTGTITHTTNVPDGKGLSVSVIELMKYASASTRVIFTGI